MGMPVCSSLERKTSSLGLWNSSYYQVTSSTVIPYQSSTKKQEGQGGKKKKNILTWQGPEIFKALLLSLMPLALRATTTPPLTQL